MPYHWERLALINNASGRHSAELPLATLDDHQRLERTVVEMHVVIANPTSGVIQTWVRYGVITVLQWTTGDPPATPDPIGGAFLNDLDFLASRHDQPVASTVFTNWYSVPDPAQRIELDTDVRRRPPAGEQGTVWLTWGLPTFTGAGVEVGFDKVISRVLIWTD